MRFPVRYLMRIHSVIHKKVILGTDMLKSTGHGPILGTIPAFA